MLRTACPLVREAVMAEELELLMRVKVVVPVPVPLVTFSVIDPVNPKVVVKVSVDELITIAGFATTVK
jgi:hypothetical protein